MGSHQQGADQRFKQVSSTRIRTPDQWEEIACRLLLLDEEYCVTLKRWRNNDIWKCNDIKHLSRCNMERMKLVGTCELSTFTTAVRNALVRMDQREKEKIREQRNRAE